MSKAEKEGINTYSETSLHSSLKQWYAQPGDRFEVEVAGSIIDIVRDDLLIEIQTRNFSAIKAKLTRLTQTHPLRLVHPISRERWLVKHAEDGRTSRRRSPHRGHVLHLFNEMIRIPHLINNPRFSLEILLIISEDVHVQDGRGSWRRQGWSIADRRLLSVQERHVFTGPNDYAALLPESLDAPFTTHDLAAAIAQPLKVAQKMAYCLRHAELLHITGKRGNALLYERARSS